MNNYPPGFNPKELDIGPQDDLCPSCEEMDLKVEYFWALGIKGPVTGDLVCDSCDYREKSEPPFEVLIH